MNYKYDRYAPKRAPKRRRKKLQFTKKQLIILLAFALLIGSGLLYYFKDAYEDPNAATGGLEFTINEDASAYTVTQYTGTANSVTVPADYDGLPVTKIGDGAFESRATLTSISLPEGLTEIGKAAFGGCSSLKSMEIPASVTYLGD